MHFYQKQNRLFEADILTVGCIAGAMRMIVAIYRDLPLQAIDLDFVVDCSLCLIFLLPLILLRLRLDFDYIVVPFSFLMIGLLCLNWIVLDGIGGLGEYYFIGGIILIALINKGGWLMFFVITCMVLELGLIYISIFEAQLLNNRKTEDLTVYHYLWITIVVTIALLYHKSQFDNKRTSLRETKKSLELKIEALERRNTQLEEQKELLQQSNDWLEKKINKRSEKLLNQRKSIEEYLSVTLFEVGPYLDSTVNSIQKLDPNTKNTPMGTLLLESVEHLQTAIQTVVNKVKRGIYYNPKN